MPRCMTSTVPSSRSASRYLARRPRRGDARPVSRSAKRSGKGKRRSRPAQLDPSMTAPSMTGARPRRTVSTSGSSGMLSSGRLRRAATIAREKAFRLWSAPIRGAERRWRKARSAATRPPSASATVRMAEKQGLVDAVFDKVARALRPHERPDVGRAAPAVEGRAGRLARRRRADAASATACSIVAGGTGDVAFRIAERSPRCRRHWSPTSMREMLAVGRRGAPRGMAERIEFVEANAEELPFADAAFRCRHDRLRHPQRAAHRPRPCRGLPRAQAGRAVPLPGVLDGRRRRARPRSTSSIRSTSSRRLGGLVTGDASPTISRRVDPPISQPGALCRHDRATPASHASSYRNLSGGIAAIHSGWKL